MGDVNTTLKSILKAMSWLDWLIVVAISAHLGSLASTNFIIANLSLAQQTAIQLEGNPLARAMMDNSFYFLAGASVLVGAFIGVYVWFRHEITRMTLKGLDPKWLKLTMYIFAFTILYVALQDFMNDFPILIKLLTLGL